VIKPRSRKQLWLGIGMIAVGLLGLGLFNFGRHNTMPFSGWGSGGVYEKGTYSSNGERIYYQGVGSDGKRIPFKAGPHWLRMMGGSCVNCHGPAGRGGLPVMMGTQLPGDIRYSALISGEHGEHYGGEGGEKHEEIAYTDEDIWNAIRNGVDPSGKSMDRTMPRWNVSDGDMHDLMEYLKTLD